MNRPYKPTILKSMREICKTFGIGKKKFYIWIENGAPIICEGSGYTRRYSAELLQLHTWRETR